MACIIEIFCSCSICFQPFGVCGEITLFFSRIARLSIAHVTLNCNDAPCTPDFIAPDRLSCGHRTHQTSIQWIMPSGLLFSNVYMRPEFMTSMTFDSVYCMRGTPWSSCWLIIMQLTNMANVLACLCSCQWRTFWTYFVTINLFSLYLMNFMFRAMLVMQRVIF